MAEQEVRHSQSSLAQNSLAQGNWALTCVAALGGCSQASFDPTTSLGKQATLDATSLQLNSQDCSGAIATIKPLFNSVNTDNDVRMMMASAYGCDAGINLFKVLGDLVTNAGVFTGGGFWAFLATEFPSTASDSAAEGAQLAEDALESVIDPGAAVLTNEMFNTTTFNPAAYNVFNRLPSANAYLFFASMAAIGSLESRYGKVYPKDGLKGQDLPWAPNAENVTADGCAYASAIVNFIDSLGALAGAVPGSLAKTIETLQTTFQVGIYAACSAGCMGSPVIFGTSSDCALADCSSCPITLRYRASCTALPTDPNSCAAAGIVNFINNAPIVGWQNGP